MNAEAATLVICALAVAGVILRPRRLPEAIWAVAGAVLLCLTGLLPWAAALDGVRASRDVCLFLAGMMLLSETARQQGVFDWLAAHAVRHAHGSATRLFTLVFGIGVVVTALLSNDATAVVLTPAVFAAARVAGAEALPLLLACALVANAASFLLPISNPASLVLYAGHPPELAAWLGRFLLPSTLAIAATYVVLRLTQRRALALPCAQAAPSVPLTNGGRAALFGIAATTLALLALSAAHASLGLPTACAGVLTALLVILTGRQSVPILLRGVAWSVLPLVAGLFVLVQALNRAGLTAALARLLLRGTPPWAAPAAGAVLAFATNAMNNLPAGLIAQATLAQIHASALMTDSLLIGIDLGPNLSITGSLATILWLAAIRREGADVSFGAFLRIGALAMPPALALAVLARLVAG